MSEEIMNPQDELRAASGEIDDHRPLVAFLYLLARDHCPVGVVEEILGSIGMGPYEFTNGWLARWAQNAAERLE